MSKKLPRCDFCERMFRPDRYNEGRQKNCTHPDCVRARKQLRQRRWHADRRASDPDFRTSENARCAEANRLRRAALKARAEAVSAAAEEQARTAALSDIVAGLVAQITDTSDPLLLAETVRGYAARGRRLSTCASLPGPVPAQSIFLDVTRHPLQAETGVLLDTRSPRPSSDARACESMLLDIR